MFKKHYYLFGILILIFLAVAVGKNQQTATAQQNGSAAIEPFMVKDINPAGDSDPMWFTEMGGKIYFSAATEENGTELWVTDGTEAGTHLVKDINPVVGKGVVFDSNPLSLTVYNGELYFRATTILEGTELWKSDGTEAGTVMVKNIYPEDGVGGAESSDPYGFVEFNGELFFAAKDSATPAYGLWKTDGTEAGTVRVGTVYVHNYGNGDLVVVGDAIYFNGSLDIINDQELWKSDGTNVGTVLVKDIRPEYYFSTPNSSSPDNLVNVNGTLFFTAATEVSDPSMNPDTELWKSDGTEAGTVRVKDINPGDESSYPDTLRDINGILYFRAKSGDSSYELWRSDGSEAGTYMVKDINPEPNYSGYPNLFRLGAYNLPVLNNEIYLYGADLTNGFELWKSDGSDAGTVLIKDIYPGADSSFPLWMVSDGSSVYFTTDNGVNGVELWQSDGTEAGTMMVKDIVSGNDSSNPQWLSVVGNWLVFSADDGVNGRELWMMLLSELNESVYLPIVLR